MHVMRMSCNYRGTVARTAYNYWQINTRTAGVTVWSNPLATIDDANDNGSWLSCAQTSVRRWHGNGVKRAVGSIQSARDYIVPYISVKISSIKFMAADMRYRAHIQNGQSIVAVYNAGTLCWVCVVRTYTYWSILVYDRICTISILHTYTEAREGNGTVTPI
jgi:hypothetical protein